MPQTFKMPEGQSVADAPKGNWVDLYAPAITRPYLRLSRADRPIGTWLLLIPCLWGIALAALESGYGWWDLWLAVSCGLGAFLMRGAGCTWNDITDRHIDAAVALAEFIRGQIPEVLDGGDRVDQRRRPPGAGKHGEGQQTEQEA